MRAPGVLSALVALAGLGGAACARDDVGIDGAARVAQELYAPTHGADLDVMQVREQSGLYKVTLRTAAGAYVDVFVSRDGERFTERLERVDAALDEARAERRFADCLKAAGVSLLVDDGASSAAQLHDLGRFSGTLAIPCPREPEHCRALGVTELPSTRAPDGTLHGGRHTVGWYETLTGCKR